MTDWPIISTVTFLPLVGVLLIAFINGDSEAAKRNIRMIAMFTTIVTFIVSIPLWTSFDNASAGFQFVEKHAWLGSGISYHVGVDGISMLFVILTTFLMPFTTLRLTSPRRCSSPAGRPRASTTGSCPRAAMAPCPTPNPRNEG